ncbi:MULTISPECIES: GIY-YIG nuclease family protein [unclassified Nocardioides]|uniref:GIY-YIG nuclease family protein n=1 Tax=unclassified Nocardioides TaxID=2615069 RepID=UPI0009EBFAC1|nr:MULTISPECIES: GIY-YIG nuclease family protein [unclassified Nocardioides]
MPWTYIVRCSDGSFYVGSTGNLERRISEHNAGLGAAYTRRRRPVELVWAGDFQRTTDAYLFEKQVQGWGRAKRIALIEGRFTDLPGLGSRGYAGTAARLRAQEEARVDRWSPEVAEGEGLETGRETSGG